ncbi:Alpha-mannosyltransferase alg11p [Colletotrichum scovillei]|nr:Alpha-mannosyltransferase alg11p [Colletotrichum scovillei]
MAASNVRPLAIFTSYMVLAAGLTAKSIGIIRNQRRASLSRNGAVAAPAHRRALVVFSALAALSLATTWYHMFRFFEWSYGQWATTQAPAGLDSTELRLGEWLHDTSLFKQAWASTLETGPRAWWSLQIFGFCANWSAILAAQERKTNDGKRYRQTVSSFSIHSVILFATLLWAMSIPSAINHPKFLSLLLGPHLLAFVPLLLNRILPAQMLGEPAWHWKVASMIWVLVVATLGVFDSGASLKTALVTLYEHPAVSSVGWDVICCWISFTVWSIIGSS